MTEKATYSHLLSPLSRGRLRLRNRVQVTSHGTFNVDEHGSPDDREAAYYRERARGGAALLTTGTNSVHPSSPPILGQYENHHDRVIPGLAAVAAAAHEHDAVILTQLGHMGQRATAPQPVWGPSAVSWQARRLGLVPHAMTEAEIGQVVDAFAAAAVRSVTAGMDGVEVAVGHGQLLNAFLSPLTNTRTDGYGGSTENRFRFVSQVVTAVREAIGDGPVLGFRINATDLTPGGLGEADWIEIAQRLEALGAGDFLNVSADFTGSLIPTTYHPHGLFLPWAARLRRVVELPVLGTGRVTDPEAAEAAIARGDVDVVGMTRAHIADPHLVEKLRTGARATIRPCIGCLQSCVGEVWRGRNVKCIYNPVTGRETTRSHVLLPTPGPRLTAVIVGAGPAGLEAARVLSGRGHRVVVLEEWNGTGGHFARYAAQGGRGEFRRATAWLTTEATRTGAEIRLGVHADADVVAALAPDLVLIATGATRTPPAWGEGLVETFETGLSKIDGPDAHLLPPTPRRIVVVDDPYGRGLLTAIELGQRGHHVTLASAEATVAPEKEFNMVADMLAELHRHHARVHTGTSVARVHRAECGIHVEVRDEAGHPATWCADRVLCTVTSASQTAPDLAAAIRRLLPHAAVELIGDAAGVGRMEHAVESAYAAAERYEPALTTGTTSRPDLSQPRRTT